MRRSSDDKAPALEALRIALQHPLVSTDLKAVCSLARVRHSWRSVVLASDACHTEVAIAGTLPQVARLAAWLPRYGGLVSSLSINLPSSLSSGFEHRGRRPHEEEDLCNYTDVADQLVAFSLEKAAAGIGSAAPAAAARGRGTDSAAVAAAAKRAGSEAAIEISFRPLRLKSFSSNFLRSPAIFSALAAASLAELKLELLTDCTANSTAFAAMGALSHLQKLELTAPRSFALRDLELPSSCLPAIAQLSQLTSLDLSGISSSSNFALLPKQLQQLTLTQSRRSNVAALLDLRHLTCLQQLDLHTSHGTQLGEGSGLPAQLCRLTSLIGHDDGASPVVSLGISRLQQLQQLTIWCSFEQPEQLQLLANLPSLQELHLHYGLIRRAFAAAPAWQHIPQLRTLHFGCDEEDKQLSMAEHAVFMRSVSAATQITRLMLAVDVAAEEQLADDPRHLEVFSYLRGLSKLQDVYVNFEYTETYMLKSRDAMHLSALTALTSLELPLCRQAVDDAVAVALACNLTRLQVLNLSDCDLTSDAALPAIGRLTGLSSLALDSHILWCNEAEGADVMLSGLTRLTSLNDEQGAMGPQGWQPAGRAAA